MPGVHLQQGDCRDLLRARPAGSADSIVTDPPYELGFMGRDWDRSGIAYDPEVWSEALRALKPGGYLLAFGGARTYHRLACAVEDEGFEIVDSIHWFYANGFPKAESQLKPAHEPVLLARKPAKRVQPLQIDACRIGHDGASTRSHQVPYPEVDGKQDHSQWARSGHKKVSLPIGRWPANVLFSHSPDCTPKGTVVVRGDGHAAKNTGPGGMWGKRAGLGGGLSGIDREERNFDNEVVEAIDCAKDCPVRALNEQAGVRRAGGQPKRRQADKFRTTYGDFKGQQETWAGQGPSVGTASRFYYCAKASRTEREEGLLGFLPCSECGQVDSDHHEKAGRQVRCIRNVHPTVKPVEVMRYLSRLVTPPGGTVVDPFMGSGTTGIAAVLEGFNFVGFELEEPYLDIARQRILHWSEGSR